MAHHHLHQSCAQFRGEVLVKVLQGNTKAVEEVLENCDGHMRDEILTVLKTAVELCQIEIVRLLEQEFHVDLNVATPDTSPDLENALFHAVSLGDLKIVRTLVELGANVNCVESRRTPLTAACHRNDIEMMTLLKRLGADVNGNLQACYGTDEMLNLMDEGNDASRSVLRWLLDNGADINLQDKGGYTILHEAASTGNNDLVNEFLRRQARILPTKDGLTPFFFAVNFAEGRKSRTIDVFINSAAISREEKINAIDYKAASFAPKSLRYAHMLLRQAWEERNKAPILCKPECEPIAAFGGVQESRTLEELESKRRNDFAILMECLAIQHRLLGGGTGKLQRTRNFNDIFEYLLSKKKYEEAIAVAEHGIGSKTYLWTEDIFETLLENRDIDNSSVFARGLQCCINILRETSSNMDIYIRYDGEILRKFLSDIETCIEFSLKLLNRYIQLELEKDVTPHKTKPNQLELTDTVLAQKFMHLFPLPGPRFCSALHAATYLMIKGKINVASYKSVVDLMAKCPLDIDEKDKDRCTVLAYVLHDMKPGDSRGEVVEFLLGKHANPAYLRKVNESPNDYIKDAEVVELLRHYYPLALSHLAAFAIIDNGFHYERLVPDILAKFIKDHV